MAVHPPLTVLYIKCIRAHLLMARYCRKLTILTWSSTGFSNPWGLQRTLLLHPSPSLHPSLSLFHHSWLCWGQRSGGRPVGQCPKEATGEHRHVKTSLYSMWHKHQNHKDSPETSWNDHISRAHLHWAATPTLAPCTMTTLGKNVQKL